MTRRLWIVLSSLAVAASVGVTLSSCNTPSCGPGTVQQQQKDGTLKCVVADDLAMNTPCDVDGGNVMIVGGKCVTAVQCDPSSTTYDPTTGFCFGKAGGTVACKTPASGKACVSGRILDFKSNAVASGPLHLELWDPTTLLTGGTALANYDAPDASQGYVFQDFSPPPIGLIVILSGDGKMQVLTGTGGKGINANTTYKIDAYTIPKTQADAWGFDYTTGGAFIAKFYKDPAPTGTDNTARETMPAPGVTLTKDGSPATGTKYFNDTLSAIDSTLTVTGNSGVAIVASPVSGNFPTFSGTGGLPPNTTMWEQLPGGSKGMTSTTPPVVIVTRFHAM